MDNQHIIDRGQASEDLLNNPSFMQIFKELMDHYINTFVSTQPAEKEARESAYFMARALQDTVGVMNQWISMRDQLLEDKE